MTEKAMTEKAVTEKAVTEKLIAEKLVTEEIIETREELARHIDVSCVQAFHTRDEIDWMIEAAKKYRFACVFTLPAFSSYVAERLFREPDISAGGSSQRTLRQSAVQCILVHHAAPRRIDEQRAGLCRGKLRRTYKPARLRREGYADAHNVRPGKYLAYTSAAGGRCEHRDRKSTRLNSSHCD